MLCSTRFLRRRVYSASLSGDEDLSSCSLLPITIYEPDATKKDDSYAGAHHSGNILRHYLPFHKLLTQTDFRSGEFAHSCYLLCDFQGLCPFPSSLLALIIMSNISQIIACEVEQPSENSPCSGE